MSTEVEYAFEQLMDTVEHTDMNTKERKALYLRVRNTMTDLIL